MACQRLGITEVGIEHDVAACMTRAAAGHLTIRQDVTTVDPRRFVGWDGLIASPPCPDWSVAGKRRGRSGETGWMVDLIPVWVRAMRPRWIALEQVPPVLPVWQAQAADYRTLGYSTWCGVLEAERWGVPQTRERAILMASFDVDVVPPPPTHQRYVPGVAQGDALECQPGLFGPGVLPWVSLADAFGHARNDWQWFRPSTTLCGDPRVSLPGHHDPLTGNSQHGSDAVKLTALQALVLQSFPADYPVWGGKTKVFQQIGNAMPPLLAQAVLSVLVGS